MPGFSELMVILVIVLVIFGAGKLPQIGDALGRGIRNFKKATNGADEIEVTPKREVTAGNPAAHAARSDEGADRKV